MILYKQIHYKKKEIKKIINKIPFSNKINNRIINREIGINNSREILLLNNKMLNKYNKNPFLTQIDHRIVINSNSSNKTLFLT